MRRLLLAFVAALFLLTLTVGEAAACSMRFFERLEVRCADQRVLLDESGGSVAAQLPGAFDSLGDACGQPAAQVEQYFTEHKNLWEQGTRTFVRWSPDAEAGLIRERDLLPGQCFYDDYERADDWLMSNTRMRPYCYDANAGICCLCPRIEFSPTLYASYTTTETIRNPGLGTLTIVLFLGLPAAAILAIIALRRDLKRLLRPRWTNLTSIFVVVILWPITRLADGLLLLTPLFWLDLALISLLTYLLVSHTSYLAERFIRHRTKRPAPAD